MSKPILVFDSGIGGFSVLQELRKVLSDADFIYYADDKAFPYGAWEEGALKAHSVALIGDLIAEYDPCCVVIACNTASTLVLPDLRALFSIPFVGTVPAIKPAAEQTKSGLVSVLATAGTVKRDYTAALIAEFAGDIDVTLVGSEKLAAMVEADLRNEGVDLDELRQELAPCFVERDGRRTDVVVLACTHYPLLLPLLEKIAPWPVIWLDPAPAIARRVVSVLGGSQGNSSSRYFSSSGSVIVDRAM